jgi:hypothetical protein
LKVGFAAVKSAFSVSIAPIKVSLGIALGAAAPLVAYGVLERGIDASNQAKTAAAPTVQLETPLTYTVPAITDKAGTEKPVVASRATQRQPTASSHTSSGTTGGEAAAGGSSAAGHASNPGGGGEDTGSPPTEPPTDPTTDPPPVVEEPPPPPPEPPADKVTICHHTGSVKNPTVTITVDAVDAHMAHGDELGACAD